MSVSALTVRAAVSTTTAPCCTHARRPVGAWRLRPRPPSASASLLVHVARWGGRAGEQGHIQRRGVGRGRRSPTTAATNGANGGNAADLYTVLGVEPTADGMHALQHPYHRHPPFANPFSRTRNAVP